jgi:hypothetical protein
MTVLTFSLCRELDPRLQAALQQNLVARGEDQIQCCNK